MACKKSELASAINSFSAAVNSGDRNLINFSANLLNQLMDTIEFGPETEEKEEKTSSEEKE